MEKAVIDFHSTKTQVLLNPRLSEETQRSLVSLGNSFKQIQGHFWIATSGSTGHSKLAALSTKAILTSAEAVNIHLQATSDDSWLLALPTFHVGGLGVLARAHLTHSTVTTLPAWSAIGYMNLCRDSKATLSALVPTQLFDLLSLDMQAPSSLRACIVGGGALSERLYQKARSLGWPVLPSFGMTECASQIATALPSSLETVSTALPVLQVLSHVETHRDETGVLVIESDSLFTGYAEYSQDKPLFFDPKQNGRFVTHDLVELTRLGTQTILTPKGRVSDTVKILGEVVNLGKLDSILSELSREVTGIQDVCIIAVPDERAQHILKVVGVGEVDSIHLLEQRYNATVLPYERSSGTARATHIPRTSLGKLRRAEVLKTL